MSRLHRVVHIKTEVKLIFLIMIFAFCVAKTEKLWYRCNYNVPASFIIFIEFVKIFSFDQLTWGGFWKYNDTLADV